jgi:translation initiation factor 2B subunit (eIF-2B alpha/beta/delta family)
MSLLDHIFSDNTSGSGTILGKVQQAFIEMVHKNVEADSVSILRDLDELIKAFPQFGLILHFNKYMEKEIRSKYPERINGQELETMVQDYKRKWESSQKEASRQLMSKLHLDGKQVLLHSNSSAIHNLFGELRKAHQKVVVWQTFSSPEGEGRLQAEFLHDLGFEVNLFHEDNLNKFTDQIDLAILGADLILEHRFLNKSGSFAIALILNHAAIPVYLLAEPRKKFADSELISEEIRRIEKEPKKSPASFNLIPEKGFYIHNYYFEFIPLDLIKQVILG